MSARVLLIEDDHDLARLTSLKLEGQGYAVDVAEGGLAGLEQSQRQPPDLVLLDVGLPDLDGLEVCRRLRAADGDLPIVFLTARGDELDRVLGLELGGDDYLVKPIGLRELVARVRAHLRRVERTSARDTPACLRHGALRVDCEKRSVTFGDAQLELTSKEFDLLANFARAPGVVFTRGRLLNDVWGTAFDGYEHTVNSHINRLRRKLEAVGARELLRTVWGVGYKLDEAPPS